MNMVQRVEMSWREQYDMYNALEKEVIIGILIEANRHLESRKPIVSTNCGWYNPGMDTSGRCIHCGKLKWEH